MNMMNNASPFRLQRIAEGQINKRLLDDISCGGIRLGAICSILGRTVLNRYGKATAVKHRRMSVDRLYVE